MGRQQRVEIRLDHGKVPHPEPRHERRIGVVAQHAETSRRCRSGGDDAEMSHPGKAHEHLPWHRMLWECGFADLIRNDYYALFRFSAGTSGRLLDAGCGTGLEMGNFRKLAPGLALHGVDISAVAMQHAVSAGGSGDAKFYQSGLEAL